jgi:hypothetical protein
LPAEKTRDAVKVRVSRSFISPAQRQFHCDQLMLSTEKRFRGKTLMKEFFGRIGDRERQAIIRSGKWKTGNTSRESL